MWLTLLCAYGGGQVLWPRLVANKLFRKPSGSHAFVADFPAVAGAAEEEFDGCSPDADAQRCVKRPRPQQRNKTLKYRYVRACMHTCLPGSSISHHQPPCLGSS